MRLPSSIQSVIFGSHPKDAYAGMLQQLPDIKATIARAREFVASPKRPTFNFNLQPTVAQLRAYIANAPASHPVSIDIETPRYEPHNILMTGISMSPWSAMIAPGTPEFMDVVAEVLADPSRMKVGHNFAYDLSAFLAAGCEVKEPIGDTIQAEALLRPPFKEAKKRRWLALSTCVLRRFPIPYWKEPWMEATKRLYATWFPDVPGWLYPKLYCALDASLTWMLFRRQEMELDQAGCKKLYFNIVAPAGMACVRMEDRGIPISRDRLDAKLRRTKRWTKKIESIVLRQTENQHAMRKSLFERQMETLSAQRAEIPKVSVNAKLKPELREEAKILKAKYNAERKTFTPLIARLRTRLKQLGDAFNSENSNHWRWMLFAPKSEGGLGLRATRLTGKAGLEGVDEDDIVELQKIYPEATILKARVMLQHLYRRAGWLASLKPDANGRVHIPYSLHRTENGRVASGFDDAEDDKPRESGGGNIQNVPEADRGIFVAEPGYVWIEGDLSQVELRVMAWLARDIQLLSALRDGIDIHSENASAIFGCKVEDARKFMVQFEGAKRPARTAVKRPTHGWDYGLGDEKCGRMFRPCEDWTESKVVEFLAKCFQQSCGFEGMNQASWARRVRQAERSKTPEIERVKLTRRVYDEANTLTAKAWRIAYFKRWPGLARFQEEIVAQVERNRVLANPYGRRLEFHNFRYDYKSQKWVIGDREEALAFLPASTVADEAKAMMPEIERCAKRHGGEILNMNHDAFSAQIPEANVQAYIADAKIIMQRPWRLLGTIEGFGEFSCPSDFKIGPSWGELDKAS